MPAPHLRHAPWAAAFALAGAWTLGGCTRLNPAFDKLPGVAETGDGTSSDATSVGEEASTGDGDATTGDGDGSSGDGDGSSGDGDGTTGDGDGTFPFECDMLDDTLVGCWEFDGDGKDGSGFGHHLSISGVTYASGVSAQAVAFSDLSIASTPTTTWLAPSSAMTIEGWIWPGANPNYTIVGKGGSYTLAVESGSLLCDFSNGGYVTFPMSFPEQWVHVACVHDGFLLMAFVDGVEVSAVAANGSITVGSAPLHIGSDSPGYTNWYDGKIDNLRIYARGLTHGEVCLAAGSCP